jgi:DNA-directed RNA polymerase subunit M/transcription elongation factor TFIIS
MKEKEKIENKIIEETEKEAHREETKPDLPEIGVSLESNEKIPKKKVVGQGAVDDKNIYATFPHVCPKCGHDKAQVIELGIWYSDEAGVVRFKCGKCGFADQSKDSNS